MDIRPCLDDVSVFVIGLDNFEFTPHRCVVLGPCLLRVCLCVRAALNLSQLCISPYLPALHEQPSKKLHLTMTYLCVHSHYCHTRSTRSSVNHTARSSGHATLYSGSVSADLFRDLIDWVHKLKEKRRAARKDKGNKGFHRTPAFIHAGPSHRCIIPHLMKDFLSLCQSHSFHQMNANKQMQLCLQSCKML